MADGPRLGQLMNDDAVELIIVRMLGAVALEPFHDLGLGERSRVVSVDDDREHAHRNESTATTLAGTLGADAVAESGYAACRGSVCAER